VSADAEPARPRPHATARRPVVRRDATAERAAPPLGGPAPVLLGRALKNRIGDAALALSSGSAVLIVLVILAVILDDVIVHGAPRLSLRFLFTAPEQGMTEGGIFPALFGTVAMVVLMIIAVVPVGVATAVYLHEYASAQSPLTRAVRIAVNNLAGVPSIVFGLFGLGFFVQFVGGGLDRALHAGERVWGQPALVWSALTMAVLTLPVVIVATEEALRAVPRELREASLALGATKLQTVGKVVLPQAVPGILTGTILAVSRGAGEVAPILFTGVAYFLPNLPHSLSQQFMHLGNHIYVLSTQSPDVDLTKPILYATVLVLLALTFVLNISAVVVRSRMRRRAAGAAA
jgi:phosphate transport system permease protein